MRPACLALAALLAASPALADVAVFEFTGVINDVVDNSGNPRLMAPIPPGSTFTGRFAYALDQAPQFNNGQFSRYIGACNSWQVTINGHTFYSAPNADVFLGISQYGSSESIYAGAWDITPPPGWSIDHSSPSDAYLILMQNVPSQGAVTSLAPPTSINLAQFTSYRELRMDFFNGLIFPGGQYSDRTTIRGTVQSITQLPTMVVTSNPTLVTAPSSETFAEGQTGVIDMHINGIGSGNPTFQWRRNGTPVNPGGRIQISTTGRLTIINITRSDEGVYDCVVNYGCGTMILGPVALGVYECPADFNRSGQLAVDDVFAFLNAWFAGCP